MAQHGQVLKLHTRRRDGKARWAYHYRVNGSRSKRPQAGGFATRREAERALKRELARLRPGREMTLTELVDQYLTIHQAAPSCSTSWVAALEGDYRVRQSAAREPSVRSAGW